MAFKPFIPSTKDKAPDPSPVEQVQDTASDPSSATETEAQFAARFGMPDFLRSDVVPKVPNDWTDPFGAKRGK